MVPILLLACEGDSDESCQFPWRVGNPGVLKVCLPAGFDLKPHHRVLKVCLPAGFDLKPRRPTVAR